MKKLYISWSGAKSKKLAEIMRDWIPAVIQAVKPYFSPDDIEKGTRWDPEMSKELEDSDVGIICLTRNNLEAPWILFEAGALAKKFEKSRVIPILFGLRTADIEPPLSQFQAAVFEKSEILRAIKSINKALKEEALELSVLENVYEKWWPDLESQVVKIMKDEEEEYKTELRSDREILEEVLALTRSINTKFEYDSFEYTSIAELELPMRTALELKNAKIKSLGDLVQYSELELQKDFSFNKKSVDAIKEQLSLHGLSLGMKLNK